MAATWVPSGPQVGSSGSSLNSSIIFLSPIPVKTMGSKAWIQSTAPLSLLEICLDQESAYSTVRHKQTPLHADENAQWRKVTFWNWTASFTEIFLIRGLAWTKSQLNAFLRRLPHHNHHMQSADPSLHAAAVPPKLVNWFSLFWQALTQKYKQTDNKTTKGSGAFLYSISKQELPTKYYKKYGVAVARL